MAHNVKMCTRKEENEKVKLVTLKLRIITHRNLTNVKVNIEFQ